MAKIKHCPRRENKANKKQGNDDDDDDGYVDDDNDDDDDGNDDEDGNAFCSTDNLCGNPLFHWSLVDSPIKAPDMWSFEVFCIVSLNKLLNK